MVCGSGWDLSGDRDRIRTFNQWLANQRSVGVINTPNVTCFEQFNFPSEEFRSMLRSIRFGPGSAYGMIRSAAWNFFVEQGALTFDLTAGKFNVDVVKMTQAVEELAITLLTIEGEGDTEAARAFLDKYTSVAPDLQAMLDQANANVPVEFVPIYPAE
jgi:hypothetical protein